MKKVLGGLMGVLVATAVVVPAAANSRGPGPQRIEVSTEAGLGRVEVAGDLAAVLQRDEGAVALLSLKGGRAKLLGRYDDDIPDSFDGDLAFSDDRRWLFYARQTHRFSKDGIHVLDVTDPAAPRLAFYQPQGGTLRIAYWNDGASEWIFTLDAIHGLVTNRFEPTTGALVPVHVSPLPALKVGGPASAGLVVDPKDPQTGAPMLYVSTGRTGVQIYDISDPVNPVEVGAWSEETGLAELQVSALGTSRTIYAATEYWFNKQLAPEVIVLDATDLGAIEEVDRFSIGAPAQDAWRVQGMELWGDLLYVAHSQAGVIVFNGQSGKVVDRIKLSGKPNAGHPFVGAKSMAFDVDVAAKRLFATDAVTGLLTIF
ncbi:MAG: hypothetical protein M3161_05710 [Actinomycetota bacterium]|nr:hypothetical protein [Actinomycetota bacterium]